MNDDPKDLLTLISEPELVNNYLKIRASVPIKLNEESSSKSKFRSREKIELEIPENFPVEIPSVKFLSNRYWQYPSVQWGNYICIYQALNIEWRSTDTMYGFIENLDCWFKAFTTGKLNQIDLPLSPPSTLKIDSRQNFLVRENRPKPKDETKLWTGFALVRSQEGYPNEIVDWKSYSEDFKTDKILALSIFFNLALQYKYPLTVFDLLNIFLDNGMELEQFFALLSRQIASNKKQKEIYLVVGTPKNEGVNKKGISDNITVWSFSVSNWNNLVSKLNEEIENSNSFEENLVNWVQQTEINWCRVFDERRGDAVQQNKNIDLDWLQGKNILLLGCGSIGSKIAEFIVRAGVKDLTIVDNEPIVTKNFYTQVYYDSYFGLSKSESLKVQLSRISKSVNINPLQNNLLDGIFENIYSDKFDLIIDTTRSKRVTNIFESEMKEHKLNCPIVSCSISSKAEYGLQIVRKPKFSNGMLSLEREAKIISNVSKDLKPFADTFWPSKSIKFSLIPESERSKSENIIPAADISWYASSFISSAVSSLVQMPKDYAEIQICSRNNSINHRFKTKGAVDQKKELWKGFSVLIYPAAINKIHASINEHTRIADKLTETGGLLFGDISEEHKTIWIDFACGPPEDTKFYEGKLKLGITGTKELNHYYSNITGKDCEYIGTWHTHPQSSAIPTKEDDDAIAEAFNFVNISLDSQILLIIGDSAGKPDWQFFIYDKNNFD